VRFAALSNQEGAGETEVKKLLSVQSAVMREPQRAAEEITRATRRVNVLGRVAKKSESNLILPRVDLALSVLFCALKISVFIGFGLWHIHC